MKNNELIAKFMGAIKNNTGNNYKDTFWKFPNNIEIQIDFLNYNESWDLLMLVIEKIGKIELPNDKYKNGERVFVKHIFPRTFGMKDEDGFFMFRFNSYQLHKDKELINAAYKAVIDVLEHDQNLNK